MAASEEKNEMGNWRKKNRQKKNKAVLSFEESINGKVKLVWKADSFGGWLTYMRKSILHGKNLLLVPFFLCYFDIIGFGTIYKIR